MVNNEHSGTPAAEWRAPGRVYNPGPDSGFPEGAQLWAGAPWWRHLLVLAGLAGIAWLLIQVLDDLELWALHRLEVLIAIGGIACWRWSWFALQNLRAMIYRYYSWPRLRRAAQEAILQHGAVPEVIVLATTYHEKKWITNPVFESIFSELRSLQGLKRRPKLVVVTGCDQDDVNIKELYQRCCGGSWERGSVERESVTASPHPTLSRSDASDASTPPLWPPEMILLRGDKGKRPALAVGMEKIAEGKPLDDGVVIILDGDTMLQPGLLAKVLPTFRLSPQVDAVTTNEDGYVKGPAWFAEWTSLRFGLRHRSMCSISLSGKLLCLTGRFSVFRASVAVDPTFREQVEHDVINHWLWGSFEMLSGDDKSTWYWLAAHEKRMLYIPDAKVTTFEAIGGSSIERAIANIRRWSGNSVRHSWRAIKIGPRKLGLFSWWCLLDQRITTVTVLFGPMVGLWALCSGRYQMLAGYLLWVMVSRLSHAAIACRQGRRLSAYYVPLQVITDWATALTKLWVTFHPAKQNWLNRGARTLNTTTGSSFYSLRTGFAHYLYGFSCVGVLAAVGLFVGFLPLGREARLFLTPAPEKPAVEQISSPSEEKKPATQPADAGSLAARSGRTEDNLIHSERSPLVGNLDSHLFVPEPWMAVKSPGSVAGQPQKPGANTP